jgi:diguanylate cyclase (GGDEF)-like protein/PAS domain S-box-containing protein
MPQRKISLDDFGLIVIGTGASALYYTCEKILHTGENITLVVTVCAILMISVFTQVLLNNINRSKEALRLANETLETRVLERTDELRRSKNRYRTIFENTGTATIITDNQMVITLANTTFVNLSGLPREAIENTACWLDFLNEKDQRALSRSVWQPSAEPTGDRPAIHRECKFRDRADRQRDVLVTFAPIPGVGDAVVSFADISELKDAQRKIYHQAFHDTLTGLPNRTLFMEHLVIAGRRAKRSESYRFAVLYLDIDRFKIINDSLGHAIGDGLLVAFAERLQKTLRDIDILGRFSGDEFVILLDDIAGRDYAERVAKRLQKELRAPFLIDGHEIFAPASLGIVLNTRAYDRPEDIIRDADTAMYHAKERGRAQFQIFDQRLHEKAARLLRVETDLRKAIQNDEFELHYQPIVAMDSGSVIGFEALIRWMHPTRGRIDPNDFIPVAEETGLIIPIGRWVLQEACRDLISWQRRIPHHPPLFMSVNISSRQFLRPKLLEEILDVLKTCGLPPSQLKLEITETAIMENTEETLRLIHRLKDSGIQMVIDDFGTGYSSMSYLQQLPVKTLKVDRSFVSKMQRASDENKNIVETIISLAHKLKMNVVAEGVETLEQFSALSAMKCQLAQGYLFSKPLEKARINSLIANIDQFSLLNPDLCDSFRHRKSA